MFGTIVEAMLPLILRALTLDPASAFPSSRGYHCRCIRFGYLFSGLQSFLSGALGSI